MSRLSKSAGSLTGKLEGLSAEARKNAHQAVRDGAEYLLGAAVDIVPLEYGDLSASGKVTSESGTAPAAWVSFDTPYAVVQHEDLTMEHDPGRRAKYLEGPMTSEREAILAVMSRRLKGVIS